MSRKCPKCGKPVSTTQGFCPSCGQKLEFTASEKRRGRYRETLNLPRLIGWLVFDLVVPAILALVLCAKYDISYGAAFAIAWFGWTLLTSGLLLPFL